VYGRDTLVLLQHYLDLGLSKTAIAQQLGISRRVVHHWIATGQLDRDLDAATPRRAKPRAQQLDPFKPLIQERLATYPALSAVRLFQECRADGYPGGITQLRDYVTRIRPRPEPEPIVRFETAPGLQAQFDFAEIRFPWGKRWALLVVLGYSRLLYVELVARQTALAVMLGLEHAFQTFGGVPREILFDQMKSVIVADHRPGGGRLLENQEFLRFAAYWGFRIRACRPYRAQTKGKVERPVHYYRSNFLYGRTFLGDADVQDQSMRWTADVANQRVHGTTKEIPAVRFARDERAALLPLAARPYRSLVLLPEAPREVVARAVAVPAVAVERRALTAYSALLAEAR
jgi:transposase